MMTTPLLRFVHISDTHIHPDPDMGTEYGPHTTQAGARALVESIRALPFTPDFVLHTGDVTYDPLPGAYATVAEIFAPLACPIHYVLGNHDAGADLQRVLLQRTDNTVQPYLYGEHEVKGVQLLILDTNGPHDPETPAGSITPEQLDWLDALCAADDDRPLIVAMHHNALAVGVPWLDDWMRLENGDEVHAVLRQARERLRGVFFGHIHQNIDVHRDGVLYSAASSSWRQFMSYPDPTNERHSPDDATPPGYSVVAITTDQTFVRRHSYAL